MASDLVSVEQYVRTIGSWMQGDTQVRMEGAESGAEILARFNRVVAQAADEVGADGCVVIVAHGAIIRYWSYMNSPEITFALAANGFRGRARELFCSDLVFASGRRLGSRRECN